MAMKTMNLGKLLLWIIVAIQIFHLGVGECGEELLLVKGEGHSKNRVFVFPSPIKSSHCVELLTIVLASEWMRSQ